MAKIDPKTLNAIVSRLRDIPRQSSVGAAAGRRPFEREFYGEVTGENEDGGAYSWKRMQPDGAGAMEDDVTGATGTWNAFHVSGLAGISVGTRVWLRFAGFITVEDELTPIFFFTEFPLPPGTGEGKVLQLDASTPVGTPVWDYLRFTV